MPWRTVNRFKSATMRAILCLSNACYMRRTPAVGRERAPAMADSVVDLTKTYDAVVIGSGAAGVMACHVLTSHGAKVLLLEAGKKLPIEKELRSMEWPYDNKYRGFNPPDYHSLNYNEYTIRRPPYGPGFESAKHLKSYIGSDDYVKNITVDERENPYTGTNYAWVRARCLGGKTNIWGRLSLRLQLAHQLQRPLAVLRQSGPLSRCHRRERGPRMAPRQHLPASD